MTRGTWRGRGLLVGRDTVCRWIKGVGVTEAVVAAPDAGTDVGLFDDLTAKTTRAGKRQKERKRTHSSKRYCTKKDE